MIELKTMDIAYTKKAIAGFSWQSLLKICINLSTAFKIFILARILSPNDFGLFSLTVIALGISESITQTGINLTIIQSKHSVKYFLNTAWVIAIIRGFLIAVIMVSLGILLSKYFEKAELMLLISLAALVPIIKGFINPAIVSLHKNMLFYQDSLYRLSLNIAEVCFAIALSLLLRSAYALVYALICTALFELCISFIFLKDKPVFEYLPSRAKVIFANTKWLSLATVLNYLNENLDDFIIGKIIGTYGLGIYHNAYSLSHKVNYEIAKSVHHASIPIYTKIVHNHERLKRAFKKTFTVTALITLLLSLPLFLFPKLTITLLLGNQWLDAIPLVRPLILAGLVQSLVMASYTLFLAKKKYQVMNKHLFISLMLMFVLMTILSKKYALTGAVTGLLFARIIAMPVVMKELINETKG